MFPVVIIGLIIAVGWVSNRNRPRPKIQVWHGTIVAVMMRIRPRRLAYVVYNPHTGREHLLSETDTEYIERHIRTQLRWPADDFSRHLAQGPGYRFDLPRPLPMRVSRQGGWSSGYVLLPPAPKRSERQPS